MKPRIKSYKSDRKRAMADHKLRVAEAYKADARSAAAMAFRLTMLDPHLKTK